MYLLILQFYYKIQNILKIKMQYGSIIKRKLNTEVKNEKNKRKQKEQRKFKKHK